ncbi:AraC family transcriptional regulator [Rhizobium paknamense]|uniref:AraC family transcriptional regulator n=1 Tax=Rhizobium paknamense TaxID=1206817 RepID=UPI0027D8DC7C|nr:AraC family transcriptional regulator [Rhizobium paknamense]
MPAIASIRASVLLPIVHFLDKITGKTDLLLASHGLLRSQLQDPYAVVPMARYVAFFEDAALLARDQSFGMRLGATFKAADIGPIGMLFSLSASIHHAFQRLSKYVNGIQSATASGLMEEGAHLVWAYDLVDPDMWPRRQESEFTLAASCQLVRSCFSRSWKPLEVHFEHAAPRDPAPLERFFRAPVLFDQPGNRLIMDKQEAEKLHRLEDMALIGVLERHVADLLRDSGQAESVTAKVQALIAISLGHKSITLSSIAADMKLSPRTLQRKLDEEGTNLRTLLQEHRQAIAELHLSQAGSSHKRAAQSAGYSDATSLWRARRRWRQSQ